MRVLITEFNLSLQVLHGLLLVFFLSHRRFVVSYHFGQGFINERQEYFVEVHTKVEHANTNVEWAHIITHI